MLKRILLSVLIVSFFGSFFLCTGAGAKTISNGLGISADVNIDQKKWLSQIHKDIQGKEYYFSPHGSSIVSEKTRIKHMPR